jgi:heme/copper-type cytochrome/quinol oxidase subunit 2
VSAAYQPPAVADCLPAGEAAGMASFQAMAKKRSRLLQVRGMVVVVMMVMMMVMMMAVVVVMRRRRSSRMRRMRRMVVLLLLRRPTWRTLHHSILSLTGVVAVAAHAPGGDAGERACARDGQGAAEGPRRRRRGQGTHVRRHRHMPGNYRVDRG